MTEEQKEQPYEIKDPSERFKEIVADLTEDPGGHDSGDEHKEVEAKEPEPEKVEADPVTPKPASDTDTEITMKSVDQYIDEDLAAVVGRLQLEISQLQSEKKKQGDTAKIDDLVTSLGDEWDSVFKDKANREKLGTAISVMKAGYKQSNIPVPDEQEIVQKALRAEFADIKSNIERGEVQSKVDDRKSQMISRASGRRTDSLSPTESATRSVHKLMIDRGLYNS
tara:strand:+ start:5532 stop:6203 length:672 start_codon:yes stop_codon:yes gene_type:complete